MQTAREQVERLVRQGAVIVEMTDEAARAQTGFACTVTLVTRDGQRSMFASNDEDLLAAVTRCVSAHLQ